MPEPSFRTRVCALSTASASCSVSDAKDKALETGAGGVDAARRLGTGVLDRSKSATGEFSSRIAERALRRRGEDEEGKEEG